MKQIGLVLILVVGCGYFFLQKNKSRDIAFDSNFSKGSPTRNSKAKAAAPAVTKGTDHGVDSAVVEPAEPKEQTSLKPTENKKVSASRVATALTYRVDEDGVAVIHGDMALGAPAGGALSGPTNEPTLQLWPAGEIPFYIQPTLPSPERVIEALNFFSNTNIHFVRYTNQADAIVFEPGLGSCKSYLGRVGGQQPIWISGGCSAKEIAHEIMHALGFVHEQNRTDRDRYIEVSWENIEADHKINFEKFSKPLARVSEMAPFDFESLMLYPDDWFSLNGRPTMKSILENKKIAPASRLSAGDLIRINSVY